MMRWMRNALGKTAAGLLLCCAAAMPATAELRFAFEPSSRFLGPNDSSVLTMRGEIELGDRERLLAFVLENRQAFIDHADRVAFVIDGGDVLEAMEIGRFLGDALVEAWLPDAGSTRCVSACFLMFAAAAARSAQPDTVGIHRPYFSPRAVARAEPGKVRERYGETFDAVRAYLDELFVPNSLSERMLSAESNDIYWLSEQDIARLGWRQSWFADFVDARCGDEGGECLSAYLRAHRAAIVRKLADEVVRHFDAGQSPPVEVK